MNFIKTDIPDVFIIEPVVHYDARGYFFESFSQKEFDEHVQPIKFVQENESCSINKGVLRGLHFQRGQHAQAKLVRVVEGCVMDVAVDLRKSSPTFGKHVAVILSDENNRQLFIPRGFAHGFLVLSDMAKFQYKCDNYYNRESESGIIWNDPTIGIDWGVEEKDVIVSDKDKLLPNIKDNNCLFD